MDADQPCQAFILLLDAARRSVAAFDGHICLEVIEEALMVIEAYDNDTFKAWCVSCDATSLEQLAVIARDMIIDANLLFDDDGKEGTDKPKVEEDNTGEDNDV
jgi:hypothetical protein